MSYKKRSASIDAGTAKERITAIKQFNPEFNVGNGLDIKTYEDLMNRVISGNDTYNGLLIQADGVGSQLDIDEKELSDMNSRVLNAIGGIYGFDSIEYEKVGGVRTRDIKHPGRKPNNNTKS